MGAITGAAGCDGDDGNDAEDGDDWEDADDGDGGDEGELARAAGAGAVSPVSSTQPPPHPSATDSPKSNSKVVKQGEILCTRLPIIKLAEISQRLHVSSKSLESCGKPKIAKRRQREVSMRSLDIGQRRSSPLPFCR